MLHSPFMSPNRGLKTLRPMIEKRSSCHNLLINLLSDEETAIEHQPHCGHSNFSSTSTEGTCYSGTTSCSKFRKRRQFKSKTSSCSKNIFQPSKRLKLQEAKRHRNYAEKAKKANTPMKTEDLSCVVKIQKICPLYGPNLNPIPKYKIDYNIDPSRILSFPKIKYKKEKSREKSNHISSSPNKELLGKRYSSEHYYQDSLTEIRRLRTEKIDHQIANLKRKIRKLERDDREEKFTEVAKLKAKIQCYELEKEQSSYESYHRFKESEIYEEISSYVLDPCIICEGPVYQARILSLSPSCKFKPKRAKSSRIIVRKPKEHLVQLNKMVNSDLNQLEANSKRLIFCALYNLNNSLLDLPSSKVEDFDDSYC